MTRPRHATRLRTLTGVVLAAGALMAASGSGASAATRLVLTENGSRVSPGADALDYHIIFDGGYGGCLQASRGEVVSNDRPTDKLAFGAPEESECLEEGYSISGAVKRVLLHSSGAATLDYSPKLTITEPGPCVYQFARLSGEFPATIEVEIEGTGTGKLKKRLSGPGCSSTRSIEFRGVESGVDNDIFGAELIS
jgi:hypothetical protein